MSYFSVVVGGFGSSRAAWDTASRGLPSMLSVVGVEDRAPPETRVVIVGPEMGPAGAARLVKRSSPQLVLQLTSSGRIWGSEHVFPGVTRRWSETVCAEGFGSPFVRWYEGQCYSVQPVSAPVPDYGPEAPLDGDGMPVMWDLRSFAGLGTPVSSSAVAGLPQITPGVAAVLPDELAVVEGMSGIVCSSPQDRGCFSLLSREEVICLLGYDYVTMEDVTWDQVRDLLPVHLARAILLWICDAVETFPKK